MLYARRHADGRIEAIFHKKPRGRSESVAADHPDVVAFLAAAGGKRGDTKRKGNTKQAPGNNGPVLGGMWTNDDLAMVRVVEDLIDVLIQKNLITLTDLPLPAQRKLMSRHGKRDDWGYVARLYPTSKEDELG